VRKEPGSVYDKLNISVVYTPYAGAAGMLLHIYGKLTKKVL
jgi:hypothetical protein